MNLFRQIDECEEELAAVKQEVGPLNKTHEITVLKSDQNSRFSEMTKKEDVLTNDKDSLKIKIRWREVAIENVKQKFSECQESVSIRESTMDILRHSLNVMHQAYAGMVIESNAREYKPQESYTQILTLQTKLALCKSQNDVAQSCISRGDVLIAV